jgi:hypothetical protein
MTENLTLPGVRILDTDIGKAIPVLDLIRAIGYNRSSVTKTLSRHDEMFKGCKTFQSLDTGRGPQQFLCLNKEGVEKLTMLLCPSEITRPELALRVREFRIKMLDRMSATVPAVIPEAQPPGKDLRQVLQYHADVAKILISGYGYKEEVAHGLAMAAVVEEVGNPALIYKGPASLPAAPQEGLLKDHPDCEHCNGSLGSCDPDYDRYFSARKIAKFTGQTEDVVRNILEKEGLTSWAHGITSLTLLGRQFGKVFITFPEWPHRTYEQKNIRWSPAAVERVKAHIAAGQTQLAETAG